MRAFIAGTDTGAGKTFATALLTKALRAAGRGTIALKPVCCGDREDAEILCAAADGELSLDDVNPLWFRAPLAPLAAARAEGRTVSLEEFQHWFARVSSGRDSLLIEGAGGWLVPLAEGVTMADLARAFGLPVLVVVADRLGCINHALLTAESIRAHGLFCSGFILNESAPASDPSTRDNGSLLTEFSGLPVILKIPRNALSVPLPENLDLPPATQSPPT